MISWKSNEPVNLQTKIVKKFAWFPILIDGNNYWLGHYYEKYRYEDGDYIIYTAPNGERSLRGLGGYKDAWEGWVLKQITLNKEDITFEEVDNFYNK